MLPFIEASRMVAKIASAVFGGVGFFVLWALWRCWPSLDLLPDAARIHVETSTGAAHGLDVGSESAPPVVLLHGSGATSIGWAAELADLSRDHRVIALDLPGEAAAPPGTRLPLEPGVHASWLAEVLAGLGVARPAVVGESLGGWVALDAAIASPEAVGPVLLLSSSGLGPRRVAPLLAAGLLGAAGENGRARALRYLTGPHPKRPASATQSVSPLTALALTTFAHFAPRTDALPVFSPSALAGVSTRVLAVYGARDRMLDARAAARRARSSIPEAEVVLIDDAGHLIPKRAERVREFVTERAGG